MSGGDWIASPEHSVNFAGLSAGEYTFEVRAITADGIAGSPASVPFKIPLPFWQTWWFVLSCVLVLFALLYLIHRVKLRRLLEMERVRTRIATDLHDDIGSNLSKISLLSDIVGMQMKNGDDKSRHMLASIAEASRASVDSMRDIVWAIDPDRDSVLEMTRKMREYAEGMCEPAGIRVKFEPSAAAESAKLGMHLRREMFLIFKEAINNAVRHSGCSLVEIAFETSGSGVLLTIKDNGEGFETTAESGGNGLRNMKDRAEKIGGSLVMESTPGIGTTVTARFP
jgi:signal transduction histidine kinase